MASFSKLGNYGRCGNAMSQIAATIAHAFRMGEKAYFPNWKYRKYFKLNHPNIIFSQNIPKMKNKYQEPCYDYRPIPPLKNCDLFGYMQSYHYFSDYEDLIRKLFSPKQSINNGQYREYCSVHVRRTDYLKHAGCYTILGPDYYYKAAELVPQNKFLVFSDDREWCKKNLTDSRFIITDSAPDYVDFFLQSACSSNIIANSSFSWWAAWLNSNPEKVVIAPKKWFGPKLSPTHPTNNLIPKEWLRV